LHIFESILPIFGVKNNIILCQLAQIYSIPIQNKIIVKFVATIKERQQFFPLIFLFLLLDPGWIKIRIREPRSGVDKNQDPGSGINIPD
jgi:hypothetical protein